MLVNARIMSISDKTLRCKLESGLTGFLIYFFEFVANTFEGLIFLNDVSDSRPASMKDLALEEGQTIACRIKKIDKTKFDVILTCKSSDLRADKWDKDYFKSRY